MHINNKTSMFAQLAFLVITSFVATHAHSATVVDQSFVPGTNINTTTNVSSDASGAQTFTVGITGTLTQVDLLLIRTGINVTEDLFVDIRPTLNGVPVENNALAFASVIVPTAGISTTSWGFIPIDFSSFHLQASQGDVLAIVLRRNTYDGGSVGWAGNNSVYGDLYLPGNFYGRNSTFPTWTEPFMPCCREHVDMGFRTYVTTVPLPSGVVLFLSGLGGLFGFMRRGGAQRKS